jgi:hypothetical protein
MKAMLEKLKNDNNLMWKETVTAAQKAFSEKGIQDNMDLMPKSLQGIQQLKSTISILEGQQDTVPKPQLNI